MDRYQKQKEKNAGRLEKLNQRKEIFDQRREIHEVKKVSFGELFGAVFSKLFSTNFTYKKLDGHNKIYRFCELREYVWKPCKTARDYGQAV